MAHVNESWQIWISHNTYEWFMKEMSQHEWDTHMDESWQIWMSHELYVTLRCDARVYAASKLLHHMCDICLEYGNRQTLALDMPHCLIHMVSLFIVSIVIVSIDIGSIVIGSRHASLPYSHVICVIPLKCLSHSYTWERHTDTQSHLRETHAYTQHTYTRTRLRETHSYTWREHSYTHNPWFTCHMWDTTQVRTTRLQS